MGKRELRNTRKARKVKNSGISRRRTQTDADIFLRRPGGGKQAHPPGNVEKLSDRIYRIVQDLFFSLSGADPAPQAECFLCAGVSAAHEKNNLSAPSASLR